MATAATPRVGIIGAGMSWLWMAMKLQDAGIESFVIDERVDEVGGARRDKTYPGLHSDRCRDHRRSIREWTVASDHRLRRP